MRFLNGALAIVLVAMLQFFPAAASAQTSSPRKTISVDTFLAAEVVGGDVTAEGMTAMLIEALVNDGRFLVVERPGLSSVQDEQDLAYAGATTIGTSAPSGQLIGASAIVRGTVTQFEPEASGGSIGVSGIPLSGLFRGRASADRQTSVIEISLRLIDTTTGQVLLSTSARGSASATSAGARVQEPWGGRSAGASAFRATPLGQAGEDAIRQAVEQIAAAMDNVPWSAQIVDAADTIYVNAGQDRNVEPGLSLNVYRQGRTLTDPSTGEVLDVELSQVGVIRIDQVRARVSTAVLVSGVAPQRGDIVRLE